MQEFLEKICDAVVNIDIRNIRALTKKALEDDVPAYEVLIKGFSRGMDIVGRKYEAGEYFLTELIGAGEVMKEGLAELTPHLKGEKIKHIGKVVLGTVRGDIHDIGKNIVRTLLEAACFDVIDLGVDVPPEKFIEKIKEANPNISAMSAMLTTTMGEMKVVVDRLSEENLREKVKVIIGGAPITDGYARKIGADAAAKDAGHGVRLCKEWMGA